MKDRQYSHKLSPKQASEGINAAIDNAKSLLEDAMLLYENHRYERSTALSILAIEEDGKLTILRCILLEEDPKLLKKEWQNYRRHTEKNISWILPDLVVKGARQLDDFNPIFDRGNDHGQILEDLKQLSLYTDSFSKCKWSIPKNVITQKIAKYILEIAKNQVLKGNRDITAVEELEIYTKHLKPVWKGSVIEMKQALINCYQEAEHKGLLKKGTTKRMIDFTL
jgi:AbiV family abortive infection protein